MRTSAWLDDNNNVIVELVWRDPGVEEPQRTRLRLPKAQAVELIEKLQSAVKGT